MKEGKQYTKSNFISILVPKKDDRCRSKTLPQGTFSRDLYSQFVSLNKNTSGSLINIPMFFQFWLRFGRDIGIDLFTPLCHLYVPQSPKF